MKVQGKAQRTIWLEDSRVKIIDQRYLPHQFVIKEIHDVQTMATAIKDMWVRGAGLIGVSAAFGMYLAAKKEEDLTMAADLLIQTRPTAVNLSWAVKFMLNKLQAFSNPAEIEKKALKWAQYLADEDVENARLIGQHGLQIIEEISNNNNSETVNILTHCNAGWLGFVDYGSALSPVYAAFEKGIKVHVWVDETRPRNQGAKLTAWELGQQGVPHTIIADNTGGHLMQNKMVDLVIVGSDRCSRNGDIANKIGTYLKALAAADNEIPFYAALPSSTIDWEITDGLKQIPIEQRDAKEVKYMDGKNTQGEIVEILIAPENSPAVNFGFDVTPARLITGIITERGVSLAQEEDLLRLFPERQNSPKDSSS